MSPVRALLAILALASGCVGTPDVAPAAEPEDAPTLPTPHPAEANPPEPAVGDWFAWDVESQTGERLHVTTRIAALDGTSLTIGVPDEATALDVQPYHVLPLGRVERGSWAWLAHDAPVRILDLPLADGKSWTGSLWFSPTVALRAMATAPGEFHVVGLDPTGAKALEYEWSDALRAFTRISWHFGADDAFTTARLVGTGTGGEGPLVVPAWKDLAKLRAGGPAPPEPPLVMLDVPGDGTIGLVCFRIRAAGLAHVELRSPSGASAACGWVDADPGASGHAIARGALPAEEGAWRLLGAAGAGVVSVEVTSYTFTPP